MKILIDNSNLFAGGGLQVAVSFINDLEVLGLANTYYIVNSPNAATVFDGNKYPDNFHFINLLAKGHANIFLRARRLLKIEKDINPDIVFTLFGPSYHKSKCAKVVGFAIPYIIYPDSPFFKKISVSEKIRYKILSLFKTYFFTRNSDALIFETENAREVFFAKKGFPKKTFTVGNTLNEIFFKAEFWQNLQNVQKTSCDILFLTANYPHKNMMILPQTIKILKQQYRLKNFKFLITLNAEEVTFPGYCNDHINFLGKVQLSQIPSLYQKSDMVFIPTLLEVFSATYLEAMYMRKPIIASDLGFSRDICGNSAYFCEPTNPEDYARAIFELAHNPSLKEDLVQKGTENLKRFGTSMDRTNSYLKIIEQIAKN